MEDLGEWWEHVEHFVAVRPVGDSTRAQYKRVLKRYLRWLVSREVQVAGASPATISMYLNDLKGAGRADGTLSAHFQVIRSFYRWLNAEQLVSNDPTLRMELPRTTTHLRETVSIEELSALWRVAEDPFDRSIVGLLGINSLRTEEITRARMEDLGTREGHVILHLPSRRSIHKLTFTVLPEDVHSAISEQAGARRAGPLFIRKGGPPSRAAQAWLLSRLAKKAGLSASITPMALTMAMRVIAIERGFSYVGVVRSAGDMETRRLAKWVERAPNSLQDHAALRLARLVVGTGTRSADHLMGARAILRESDAPPAIAAVYAGATLENHLRELAQDRGVTVTTTNPKLASYSAALSARGVFAPSEVQLVARIQDYRNFAAHGRFDNVSAEDALWTIREVEYHIRKFPLNSDAADLHSFG